MFYFYGSNQIGFSKTMRELLSLSSCTFFFLGGGGRGGGELQNFIKNECQHLHYKEEFVQENKKSL